MKRKRAVLFGGALIAAISLGLAGYYFFGTSIRSYLQSFLGDQSDTDQNHGTQAGHEPEVGNHPVHENESHLPNEVAHAEGSNHGEGQVESPPSHGDARSEELAHPVKESPDDGHGGGNVKATELVPAADYSPPKSRLSPIVRATREMSSLQTRMAIGDKDAPAALKAVMKQIPRLIGEVDKTNQASSLIQATALYVLSGGDPLVAERLLKANSLSEKQVTLLTGVISYAKADFKKASELLSTLELEDFETTLSAQLSMAQAQAQKDALPPVNVARLAYAANAVPGTLIEEAAIRRIVPILAASGESKKFTYWAQRYLRKYKNSLYYQDFETSLITALSHQILEKDQADGVGLTEIMESAGEDRAASLSRSLLLQVILAGTEKKCELVKKSIASAFDITSEKFRSSSALITICESMKGTKESLEALESLEVANFDAEVKVQVEKALSMARTMQADLPPVDETSVGPHLPLSVDEAYAPLFASVTQQIDASVSAIRRVDDESGPDR